MSFLAGRLASTEGSYFLQESKNATGRLAQKIKQNNKLPSSSSNSSSLIVGEEAQADVLPEVLRHSLPLKLFEQPSSSESSLYTASKWALRADPSKASSVSADALNPLRAYVSLPQVTFGPKRWELPNTEHSNLASTANRLRHDGYTHVSPEKLKAAAEGLSRIGKAFFVATVLVFGGSTLTFALIASKLELHNGDDIKTKGKDILQPKFEVVKEQLRPFKVWAENVSKKWHVKREEEIKEKPIIKELSRRLGPRTSS
ncbi:uncharacterized protein LOC122093554 [Macadamia integrifolia]|uniref:uncharacterized protein LOC122093554 n=1 Tax=Macadamia integrifolia TaxID=60698 RepID=UPI001C531E11|nr:uncharacterized protein LOC122093554 [Macadamia integrifolia]